MLSVRPPNDSLYRIPLVQPVGLGLVLPAALWVGLRDELLTLNLWGSRGLAKHNKQMLFHARGGKISENPLHHVNSKNVALVGLRDQAFKPPSLEIRML